jgi:hypothetical protein
MIRRAWPVFVSVLMLIVLSCPVNSPISTDDLGGLEITYRAEDAEAVSATVTAAGGGQLTATSSSGVVLELVVPAGAVDSDQKITLTPLRELIYTPLDGGTAHQGDCIQGCLLGPDGLEFDEPATLTVTYPDAGLSCLPDTSYRIVAFSDTSAFYEVLPTTWDVGTPSLTCQVRHFSGYGVDQMSDYEFLHYLITQASRHA